MSPAPKDVVRWKRSRFVARFPSTYLYSPAHFWLSETEPGLWRIGITTFAARMLGEIVEFDFEVPLGNTVAVGQVVGWVEGFKATADLFSVADGELVGGNPKALANAELVCSDPYGDGWLYSVRGTPDPQCTDIEKYLEMLGETIDQMEEKPWQTPEMGL
ncbi:MAG: glycine cleavage system protein H [Acidobacteriota bacterium]